MQKNHPTLKKSLKITLPLSSWAMTGSGFIYQCLQEGILENLVVLGWLGWVFLVDLARKGLNERSGWWRLMICWYVVRAGPLFSFESIWNLCCSIHSLSWFANHKQVKMLSQVTKMPCEYNNNFFILCGLPPLSLECYSWARFSWSLPQQGHDTLFPFRMKIEHFMQFHDNRNKFLWKTWGGNAFAGNLWRFKIQSLGLTILDQGAVLV